MAQTVTFTFAALILVYDPYALTTLSPETGGTVKLADPALPEDPDPPELDALADVAGVADFVGVVLGDDVAEVPARLDACASGVLRDPDVACCEAFAVTPRMPSTPDAPGDGADAEIPAEGPAVGVPGWVPQPVNHAPQAAAASTAETRRSFMRSR